ncbi:hypothetical protein [Streptomyces sp. DH24]|uniref:hypothetical protein n=1 Tax=Streptomyces sp. DH24 TaxID=3040123 RepID=UPI002442976E|nr:hypothetical protein [Streptomyces sp. DH24]MDG9721112.1 hypothetical protein [Streptomyces sp. DH24]
MIASTSVARWTWGRDDETVDALVCCLRDLLAAYQVLATHRFAVDATTIHVSVSEAGTSNSLLFEGTLAVPTNAHEAAKAAPQLAEQVREAMRVGEIGSVDAYAECSGMVVTGADAGKEERQDGLFRLGASSFADFVTVDLVTHTDVWLPYDLKGRPQPEVYGANGARLSAALRELAEALESETDPDDPTYFAKPTATGAENFFAADGSASDVWGSFEVPTRYDIFTHAPGFGRIGYRRTAEGEAQHVPVVDGSGEVLGHLWVSDAENAASFEPLDVGDDATYRAGVVWLERLRAAHKRGLPPSTALAELSTMADTEGAGRVDPTAQPRTVPLSTLRNSHTGQ